MRTNNFDEIAEEFLERANRLVWCSVATVDGQGRPRSRILHPIWEHDVAWITTNPASFKSRHLAKNPFVSLAYIDIVKPAYADCRAEWVTDPAVKQHVWDLLRCTPEPLGFDPGLFYNPIDGSGTGRPDFGVLKLTPYRIVLAHQWPEPLKMWTPAPDGDATG